MAMKVGGEIGRRADGNVGTCGSHAVVVLEASGKDI